MKSKSMVFAFWNTSAIADQYVTWWVKATEPKPVRKVKPKAPKVKQPTDRELDKLALARMDDDGAPSVGLAMSKAKVNVISQETLAFWRRYQGQAEINLKALEVGGKVA